MRTRSASAAGMAVYFAMGFSWCSVLMCVLGPTACRGGEREAAKTQPPAASPSAAQAKPADDPRVRCPPGTTQHMHVESYMHTVTIECVDSDGYWHGPMKEWWPNGNPKSDLNYARGELEGRARSWFEEGGLSLDGTYHKSKFHGQLTYYHRNGKVAAVGEFENGRLVGKARAFDEKGRPVLVKDPRRIFPFLYDFGRE